MEVFYLYYKIAFDKKDELEIFVFNHMFYDSEKKIFFSTYKMEHFIGPIGSFLLMFLNTDFENDDECKSFIFWFCFENLYYQKYPEIKQTNRKTISHLKLSFSEFVKELDEISNENKEEFLYLKQTLLKNLRLPYDSNIFRECEHEAGYSKEEIQQSIQDEKDFYKNKSIKYDETEINGFIEHLNINFETISLILSDIDITKYSIPYFFEGEDIMGIIALIFKEFMSDNHNTIRQCQNCGYYFVPSNLNETKYCNLEFEDTGKTCRQIGKELAYKKALKEDKVLDKYRRRYMSLASSVSHYGTDTAIIRFEKYKKDGAIMKAKYLNKEITPKEFEKWIESTKKWNTADKFK